jgi:hypothetical protein
MAGTDGAGRTGACGATGVGRRTGGWGLVLVPEVLASVVPLAVWPSEVAPAVLWAPGADSKNVKLGPDQTHPAQRVSLQPEATPVTHNPPGSDTVASR